MADDRLFDFGVGAEATYGLGRALLQKISNGNEIPSPVHQAV
jgi:hypothetical protein